MKDIREFLDTLQKHGDLAIISAPVDPQLEIAEIHRRIVRENGPALLFTDVKGSPYKLATNLLGSKRRVELAFGKNTLRLFERLANLPVDFMPPKLTSIWKNRDLITRILRSGIKKTSRLGNLKPMPPCLNSIPLIKCWQKDGGCFFTLPIVYTQDPETGISNLGMYRMQRYDNSTTGFHVQIVRGAGAHLAKAHNLGRTLPVSVFLSPPPALMLSAIAPLPENIPELLLASFLMAKKLKLAYVSDFSSPLLLDSEAVLLGYVDPQEERIEGPFGDHYGYYSLEHPFPVFRCERVYMRDDPIFTATVVGKPPQEDLFIGNYLQHLLKPFIKLSMPGVEDIWAYGETGYHCLASARITERHEREAFKIACRILGEGQLSLTKALCIIDGLLELSDFRTVLEYLLQRLNWDSDIYILTNTHYDTLDYNSGKINRGSKLLLIGVGDVKRELRREPPKALPSAINNAAIFCGGCLVISLKDGANPDEIAKLPELTQWEVVIIVDNANTTKDYSQFLWEVFTRFDPANDIIFPNLTVQNGTIKYKPPMLIDARTKPHLPEELEPDENTVKLVDRRWNEYWSK